MIDGDFGVSVLITKWIVSKKSTSFRSFEALSEKRSHYNVLFSEREVLLLGVKFRIR